MLRTNKKEQIDTLFYCRSQLQSMIVNKLLEMSCEKNAMVIYHPINNSEKHAYYFDRINSTKKIFIPWESFEISDTLSDIVAWWRLPKSIRENKFKTIFISSFGSIPVSILIHKNKSAKICTYDDGSLNTSKTDFEEWVYNEPVMRRIVKRVMGGCNIPDLMSRVEGHYTIYPKNLIVGMDCQIIEVDLFSEKAMTIDDDTCGRKVRVLLGSWFLEKEFQARHDAIVDSGRFDLFIPHPGDNRHSTYVEWLRDSLVEIDPSRVIAEDVVRGLVRSGFKPIVYGFNSTALLNIGGYVSTVSIILDSSLDTIGEALEWTGVRRIYYLGKNRLGYAAKKTGHRIE